MAVSFPRAYPARNTRKETAMGPEEWQAEQDAAYAEELADLMRVIDALESEVFA